MILVARNGRNLPPAQKLSLLKGKFILRRKYMKKSISVLALVFVFTAGGGGLGAGFCSR
jgi:hypothetical protein